MAELLRNKHSFLLITNIPHTLSSFHDTFLVSLAICREVTFLHSILSFVSGNLAYNAAQTFQAQEPSSL